MKVSYGRSMVSQTPTFQAFFLWANMNGKTLTSSFQILEISESTKVWLQFAAIGHGSLFSNLRRICNTYHRL